MGYSCTPKKTLGYSCSFLCGLFTFLVFLTFPVPVTTVIMSSPYKNKNKNKNKQQRSKGISLLHSSGRHSIGSLTIGHECPEKEIEPGLTTQQSSVFLVLFQSNFVPMKSCHVLVFHERNLGDEKN